MPTHALRRSVLVVALPLCAALLTSCASSGPDNIQAGVTANESADPSSASAVTIPTPGETARPDADGGRADAATFVCDTIQRLRSDYAGVEDDLTTGAWINGFVAALSDAPEQRTYRDIVEGRADVASSARCPAAGT